MNQFLIKNSIINLTQKAKKLPSVTAQDIAMFMQDNKGLISGLKDGIEIKFPNVRDLCVKEASLLIEKYDDNKNRNIILSLKGYENQSCVKQVIFTGDKKSFLETIASTDFLNSFEGKFNALRYYLTMK